MKAIRSNPRVLFTVIAVTAALAGCVAPKAPPPAPPPPAPKPAPPRPLPRPPADWRDAAQTPGTWLWSNGDGKSTATFAVSGSPAIASLTCDKAAGLVLLARQGQGVGAVPMQVTTSGGSRPVLSDPARSPAGWIVAALPTRDPLLDAMAFSRGRFALETAGAATLYLPSWPELSRVIEDCR
ncbi:MAG: hypothetical protein ACKOQ3_13875 [Novosphingobium sp.]